MVSFDDLFWFVTGQLGELAAVVDATRKVPDPFHRRQHRTAAG
ncbi:MULTISPECIES: hypothetical protein [unclassified Streptomyces]|nr:MULTISPECIES: hypothetical protein [unclassified Streptomyces]